MHGHSRRSRREFLTTATTAALAGATMPYWSLPCSGRALGFSMVNGRHTLGCIGTGDRWYAVGPQALVFADGVAVCDVDRDHMEKGKARVLEAQSKKGTETTVEMYEDYRKLLDRKDIDVVTIVTPDHWHSKIAIDAMRAGKDVYCEKPLTLTILEGRQIEKVLKETGRVFQVGTQQRSEMNLRFLHAVAMVREGRIGKLRKATCAIGSGPTSGELPKAEVPKDLNWNMWLGQAPMVEYVQEQVEPGKKKYPQSRTHYEFRWWYEYSGGKMTDWGAHHVDIAMWALGHDATGPTSVEGTSTHPVPFEKGMPTVTNRYNVATNFNVQCKFADGTEIVIRDECKDLGFDNGILLQGTEGDIFVSRGKLEGKAVDELKEKPLDEARLVALYKGKTPGNHMKNFFDCIADRTQPISDVPSHHRAMTTCHLANIAIRLGRKIQWDPNTQQIVGDAEAAHWVSREQRKGFEIDVSV